MPSETSAGPVTGSESAVARITSVVILAAGCGGATVPSATSGESSNMASSGSSGAATQEGSTSQTSESTTEPPERGDPNGTGGEGGEGGGDSSGSNATPPNYRVAFFGDHGLGTDSIATLQLVASEEADLLVVLGDFDYFNDPDAWNAQLDEGLPAEFPVLGVIGNHDKPRWADYREILEGRLGANAARCTGEIGVMMRCDIFGITYLFSGIGTMSGGDDEPSAEAHVAFLTDELARSTSRWKICAWHKNQHEMQVGYKTNEVGWEAYRACQAGGALVATGHEHSYSRTLTLDAVGDATVDHGAHGEFEVMQLGDGENFVFVAGLGGRTIRRFNPAHMDESWWATYYTSDRYMRSGELVPEFVAAPGVLFIDFHVSGDPTRARGYFKNILGEVVDDFEIVTQG